MNVQKCLIIVDYQRNAINSVKKSSKADALECAVLVLEKYFEMGKIKSCPFSHWKLQYQIFRENWTCYKIGGTKNNFR